jgi:tol-pal system protein YbgF
VLLACLAFGAAPARAALFEDDEARRAIIDLRQRLDEANKAQAAAAARSAEQVDTLRRSLLDLNNQLETMRSELANLRGTNEELARAVAELQKRQQDAGQSVDDRLRKLEPAKVSVDGREFVADPEEKRAYDEAMSLLRMGDFGRATAALASFQKRYPSSGYADSVRFWLGNAQYGQRNYKDAVATFRAFISAAPTNPRAPEAMLALANSQAEMKDLRGARRTLEDLLKAYPQSEAAVAGRERLAALK